MLTLGILGTQLEECGYTLPMRSGTVEPETEARICGQNFHHGCTNMITSFNSYSIVNLYNLFGHCDFCIEICCNYPLHLCNAVNIASSRYNRVDYSLVVVLLARQAGARMT